MDAAWPAVPLHERCATDRHHRAQGLGAGFGFRECQEPVAGIRGAGSRDGHDRESAVGAIDDAVRYPSSHHMRALPDPSANATGVGNDPPPLQG